MALEMARMLDAREAPLRVHEAATPHHDVPASQRVDLARHPAERPREQGVVGVENPTDRAGREAEALVHGLRVTAIRFGHEREMRIALEVLERPVRGSAVDHDML